MWGCDFHPVGHHRDLQIERRRMMKYRVVIPQIEGDESVVGKFMDDLIEAGVNDGLSVDELSQITIIEVKPTFFERVREALQEIFDAFSEVG
jgi:hypothetical protein